MENFKKKNGCSKSLNIDVILESMIFMINFLIFSTLILYIFVEKMTKYFIITANLLAGI